jgi:hypothetical protein
VLEISNIEKSIISLENERTKVLSYTDKFTKEHILQTYKALVNFNEMKRKFVYYLKTKEELVDDSLLAYNFIILIVLYFASEELGHYKLIGFIILLILISIYVCIYSYIIFWEVFERNNIFSFNTILLSISILFYYAIGNGAYVINYGDEELNSFYEKPEYRTQYYVNVFPDNYDTKNYRLPSDIYVFSETMEAENRSSDDYIGGGSNDYYTEKYIILEKVYWPNGGYLEFEDCQLIQGERVKCIDKNEDIWYIELTDHKVGK